MVGKTLWSSSPDLFFYELKVPVFCIYMYALMKIRGYVYIDR